MLTMAITTAASNNNVKNTALPLFLLSAILLRSTRALSAEMTTTKAKFITNKMCPFAQKAWIALEASGIDYELQEISLYGPNGKPNWFWDLNPAGTVPVLVCEQDLVLADSDLILDKIGIEELNPSSSSSELEDKVKAWRNELNSKLLPVGKRAVLSGGRDNRDKLTAVLKQLDAKVVGPYLCGTDITVADCHAFPFLWRLDTEFDLSSYPNLHQWLQHCQASNPSFTKTIQSSWWWWW